MSRTCQSCSASREHNGVAALSYYELAVILGHRDAKITAGASLEWSELLRAVEKVQAAVKVKADAEEAEKAAEAERLAAEKAAAEETAAIEAALEELAYDVESEDVDIAEVIDDAA